MTDQKARTILKKHCAAYGDTKYEPALWVIEALQHAVKIERDACGEIANKKAAEVIAKNTAQGRTNSAAAFAATMLEDVGASIRARSNVKVRGDGPAPPARRPSGEAAPRP